MYVCLRHTRSIKTIGSEELMTARAHFILRSAFALCLTHARHLGPVGWLHSVGLSCAFTRSTLPFSGINLVCFWRRRAHLPSRSALRGTGWKQKQPSAAQAGLFFKSSRSGRRVTESSPGSGVGAWERRRLITRDTKGKKNQRILDMAAVKTFDLLVGVVLVLQSVWRVQAEITAGNGKHQVQTWPVWIDLEIKCYE